jgi:hypothetical protein
VSFLLRAGLVALAGLLASGAALRAQEVGTTILVDYWAYRTPAGQARADLFLNEAVYSNDTITSLGQTQIRFLDQTEIVLGPDTELVLDRFVYDPARSTGQFAAQFAVGAFRFVSGKIEDGSYSIRTPTANLGIRGTSFQVLVDTSGMTRVDVFEGLVAIEPLGRGRGAEVGEGRSGTVRTADSDVEIGDASVPAQRYRLRDDIERAAAPGRDDAGGSISFGQR